MAMDQGNHSMLKRLYEELVWAGVKRKALVSVNHLLIVTFLLAPSWSGKGLIIREIKPSNSTVEDRPLLELHDVGGI